MPEETHKTDKKQLGKGVRTLMGSLLPSVIGPTVLYNAFMNKSHDLFWVVFSIGVIIMLLAIFLIFKGIRTMINSIFDE